MGTPVEDEPASRRVPDSGSHAQWDDPPTMSSREAPRADLQLSPASKRFVGHRLSPSSTALVTVEDAGTGELIGTLPHAVRYSPTGLNWGYAGAGPRELARCLLAAVLEDEAHCPVCGGHGPGPDQRCCHDGLRTDLPDEKLAADVIAHLDATWVLTDGQLRTWWHTQQPSPA